MDAIFFGCSIFLYLMSLIFLHQTSVVKKKCVLIIGIFMKKRRKFHTLIVSNSYHLHGISSLRFVDKSFSEGGG